MKSCPICKKGTIVGGHRSNRVRATKFNPTGKKRKYPNLQWATLPSGLARGKAGLPRRQASKRIKICTDCLKKGRHFAAKL